MKEDSPFISYVSFKRAFHAKSWFEEPFSFHNAIEIRFEWGFLDCFKELPLFEFVRLTSMQAPNNGCR
jgi:hypothetical protein